jgi:Tetratricopeptide repeat
VSLSLRAGKIVAAKRIAYFRDYTETRRLQEPLLEMQKRVLGEEHPDTLLTMNNLALTLMAQGDYQGARQLQERGWR